MRRPLRHLLGLALSCCTSRVAWAGGLVSTVVAGAGGLVSTVLVRWVYWVSDVDDWLYLCHFYRLRHRASDTMLGTFHMPFGRCWACVEIFVD